MAMHVAYKRDYAVKANVPQLKVEQYINRQSNSPQFQIDTAFCAHETLYACIPHGRNR